MKILQISTDKPSQYLVVSPKITNIKQLNGKTIAISDTSGNSTLLFRELLSKNGVAVETVQTRALGEPLVRLGALLGGAVDATMILLAWRDKHRQRDFAFSPIAGIMSPH